MSLPFLLGLVFTVLFLATVAILALFGRKRHPAVMRIKELRDGPARGRKRPKSDRLELKRGQAVETTAKLMKELGFFVKQAGEGTSKMRTALVYAGFHREDSVKIFAGAKLFSAVFFFLLFVYVGLHGNRPLPMVLLLSIVASTAGYFFPDVILNSKAHKRQEQIARNLPDAIDLLVIGVEAGLGLNAALLRIGSELVMRCRPIAEEFGRVNQDLRTGVSREKALRNLSDRNKVEDLRIFVGALILSDRLGTSIADTLRAQADSLRTRIRQKAEEQAAKAGIKMLFPLVLFILPALIIILMGPALILVVRTFNR